MSTDDVLFSCHITCSSPQAQTYYESLFLSAPPPPRQLEIAAFSHSHEWVCVDREALRGSSHASLSVWFHCHPCTLLDTMPSQMQGYLRGFQPLRLAPRRVNTSCPDSFPANLSGTFQHDIHSGWTSKGFFLSHLLYSLAPPHFLLPCLPGRNSHCIISFYSLHFNILHFFPGARRFMI